MMRSLITALLVFGLPVIAIAQTREPTAEKNLHHAQAILLSIGFAPGEPDGAMGPRTRQAITSFQKQHGIHQTGSLDATTWEVLWRNRNGLIPETEPRVDREGDLRISGMVTVTSSSQGCRSPRFEVDLRSETSLASDMPAPIFYKGVRQVLRGRCCIPFPGAPYTARYNTSVKPGEGASMGIQAGRIVSSGPMLITGDVAAAIPSESRVLVFDSVEGTDLVFELTAGGYRYVSGKGTLELPGGAKYTFSGTQ